MLYNDEIIKRTHIFYKIIKILYIGSEHLLKTMQVNVNNYSEC